MYRKESLKATTREEWSYYTCKSSTVSPNSKKLEKEYHTEFLHFLAKQLVSYHMKGKDGPEKTIQLCDNEFMKLPLGPQKAKALPMLHALTGCDKGSFFSGRGKRTTWNVFGQITYVLVDLSSIPETIPEEYTSLIESFVITSLQQSKCS